jgi:hypothetical protein
LARLGAGGLFGAAVLGSINKFGETVKQASTDYYQSQKALSDAFEMSFKSTSVEQAQAGLEKTEDTIESLRGKITQLGAFGGILKGIEKFTGINLGVGDTEKALKDARDNLKVQEQLVETRQFEKAVAKEAETKGGEEAKRVAASKILAELESVRNGEKVDLIKNAKEELKLAEYLLYLNGYQIEELYKRKSLGVDIKKLDELTRDGQIKDLEVAKARLSLAKAIKAERAIESKQAQEAGGGLLGASRAGQQALDTARKVRAREVNKEDFRTQDQVFEKMKKEENVKRKAQGLPPVTSQNMRERVAAQQAAGEMPLLSEKLGAMQGATPASQIAAEKAKGGGGADMQKQLLEAIKALSEQIPAAVATG